MTLSRSNGWLGLASKSAANSIMRSISSLLKSLIDTKLLFFIVSYLIVVFKKDPNTEGAKVFFFYLSLYMCFILSHVSIGIFSLSAKITLQCELAKFFF